MKTKVAIAMSGGVDSSVAAALLIEQGYDVIGIHMKLWSYLEVGGNINHESGCCSLDSVYDCRMVCGKLNIPFYTVDFSESFQENVIENFKNEYLKGRTPNPCVICNSKIKWEHLLEKCREFGAEYVATGHYAKIHFNTDSQRYAIQVADYRAKDQSYYLWGLSQDALKHSLFPLAELSKPEVRKIAGNYGFRTANKAESMEICFVKDNNYRRFLEETVPHLKENLGTGDFVDNETQMKLGNHEGYPFFTIGQRKGLGGGYSEKKYVVDIHADSNTVILGSNNDLLADGLIAENVNFQKIAKLENKMDCFVKIRYHDDATPATIETIDDRLIKIHFKSAKRAVTPGQSTVFYDENACIIGGGIIHSPIRISHVSS